MKIRVVLAILGLLVTETVSHASLRDLPIFRIPDCLGVNIHFVDPDPGEMNRIAEAGFGVLRMDLKWDQVEQEPGVYDFRAYEELTRAMRDRQIVPMYILDYSNDLYEENRSVVTPEGREAFARFAAEAVIALGQGPVIWEVWNEPNHERFWEDQPSVNDYVALVEETSQAMRLVDPLCTIVGPATSQIPMDYLEACFEAGLLNWVDAVSVHPYRHNHPETVLEEYQALRELIDDYSPDKFIPILSGEWGYSIHPYRDVTVDEAIQANFLVRQFLSNFMAKVRVSIWYDWRNDGPDAEELEHNFGTVDVDGVPKMAYRAAQVFSQQLRGLTYITTLPTEREHDYLAVFSNGEREVLVAWTTAEPHAVFLRLDAPVREAITQQGVRIPIYGSDRGLEVPLMQEPLYLHAERIHRVQE